MRLGNGTRRFVFVVALVIAGLSALETSSVVAVGNDEPVIDFGAPCRWVMLPWSAGPAGVIPIVVCQTQDDGTPIPPTTNPKPVRPQVPDTSSSRVTSNPSSSARDGRSARTSRIDATATPMHLGSEAEVLGTKLPD